jgi:hypothetical protein
MSKADSIISPAIEALRMRKTAGYLDELRMAIPSQAEALKNYAVSKAKGASESIGHALERARKRIKFGPMPDNVEVTDVFPETAGATIASRNDDGLLKKLISWSFKQTGVLPDDKKHVVFMGDEGMDELYKTVKGWMPEKQYGDSVLDRLRSKIDSSSLMDAYNKHNFRQGVAAHEAQEALKTDRLFNDTPEAYSTVGALSGKAGNIVEAVAPMWAYKATYAGTGNPLAAIGASRGAEAAGGVVSNVSGDLNRLIDRKLTGKVDQEMPLFFSNPFVSSAHADPSVILEESNWLRRHGRQNTKDMFRALREHTGEWDAFRGAGIADKYGLEELDPLDPILREKLHVNYRGAPSLERKLKSLLGFKDISPYQL